MGVPGAQSVSTTVGSGPAGTGPIVTVAKGVTIGETNVLVATGVTIVDRGAPLCDVLWGGVSGLQAIRVTNTMKTNNGVLNRFEETAMFDLLMTT